MDLVRQSPACARGEERTVILWITAPFNFKTVYCAQFMINNTPKICMLTCTGGAPPLVARVCAPVCSRLAMPREVCNILLKVVIM